MRCHPDYCEHFHQSGFSAKHGYCSKKDESLWVTPWASCARSKKERAPGCSECNHWTPMHQHWGSCARGVTGQWFTSGDKVASAGWCEQWAEASPERRIEAAHESGRLF